MLKGKGTVSLTLRLPPQQEYWVWDGRSKRTIRTDAQGTYHLVVTLTPPVTRLWIIGTSPQERWRWFARQAALLWSQAQAAEEAGDAERAQTLYQRILQLVPNTPLARKAQAALSRLAGGAGGEERTEEVVPSAPSAEGDTVEAVYGPVKQAFLTFSMIGDIGRGSRTVYLEGEPIGQLPSVSQREFQQERTMSISIPPKIANRLPVNRELTVEFPVGRPPRNFRIRFLAIRFTLKDGRSFSTAPRRDAVSVVPHGSIWGIGRIIPSEEAPEKITMTVSIPSNLSPLEGSR
jgi:hypothetical protein